MTKAALAIHQLAGPTKSETHPAPERSFTTEQARTVMQLHIACRAKRCPRKAAALQALADAGRVVPSTTKPR